MIRLAKLSDTNHIMDFIDVEWKKDHILARNKDFFLFEHQNNQDINFVISEDVDGSINGLLGFIPASSTSDIDICTVIWKVSKRAGNPMLGVELLNFLIGLNKFRTVMSVGINRKTIGIYRYLGMYVDKLKHYVLINNQLPEFKIASIAQTIVKPSFQENGYELRLLERDFVFDFEKYSSNILYKDEKYFKKRYFDHPIYKYNVYGVVKEGSISSLIIIRIQKAENSKVLRIVDFIGNESELKYITKSIYEMLIEQEFEYADFYCFGISNEILIDAGFNLVDSENIIIPNYFQPFVRENIEVYFFSNTKTIENLRLFKADGDQDRPN